MRVGRITIRAAFLVGLTFSCGCAGQGQRTADNKACLSKASRYDKDGWIFVHIEGQAFERGFQRGYLTAGEIERFYKTLSHTQQFETGKEIDFFVKSAAKLFAGKLSRESVEEMRGMVAGAQHAGKNVTYEQMLFMNGFLDVMYYWWPTVKGKYTSEAGGCSAFLAAGDATKDGGIVMAHNSWGSYPELQFANIIVEIVPDKGNKILMQSWGPCIYSATDFFITSAGLVGTETTIGGFRGFNAKGTPVFERARRAMQYANTIDQWADIMIKNNSGAYANSWLVGDVNTGEIARLELGLKYHRLEKKTAGYFVGSNVADDVKILRLETDAAYDDIRDRAVSRRVRWKQLMEKYHGRIDVEAAKKMLADHYDVYLKKDSPSSRTICGHYELDDSRLPASPPAFRPAGAIDGKVVDSQMTKSWRLWAKWGSSCDIAFDANDFLKEHPQYDWLRGYLDDRPEQPWIILPREK